MNDHEINSITGGYVNAAPLADIPGVDKAYNELLARIQSLPFVPTGWHDAVDNARKVNDNRLWLPRYAIRADAWNHGATSPLLDDVPVWLHDTSAAVAWNKLTDWWTARLQPVLAGWARDHRAVMESANNEAAFWNTLYTVVKPIAVVGDTIIAAPEKVAAVASGVAVGVLKKFWPVLLILVVVGVGALVYKNKLTKATV